MIGDANSLPVLKASASFSGIALIDADVYIPGGNGAEWYTNQNNFFRQVRNFVIDLTGLSLTTGTGIHWQVSQATSLQNIIFQMIVGGSGNGQQGIYMENGSGGFFGNLTFNGGNYGMSIGNQQFTTRNLIFNNVNTAINVIWDWGWTFKGLTINNCGTGITMSGGSTAAQQVGSAIVLDSVFTNVGVGITTLFTSGSLPTGAGSLRIDNVNFVNTPIAVSSSGSTVLAGNQLIGAWGQGSVYSSPSTTSRVQGTLPSVSKPSILLDSSGNVFQRNKPQYQSYSASQILSAKANGCAGDGVTDDTAAIQALLNSATTSQVVFFDHGAYLVSNTIKVPANIKITGEIWPIIIASGTAFQNAAAPIPVWQVGQSGQTGNVEISDLIFETLGPQPGAILIEWNVQQSSQGSAGLWDVHGRIGGSAGTKLLSTNCIAGNLNYQSCSGPFLQIHVTSSAGIYMENTWFWTADHDLDTAGHSQVSIFTGRGVLIESQGPVWLYGTAAEHNQLYNYQFSNAQNIFVAMIQTETPYYQSVPNALTPFAANSVYNDPTFSGCASSDLTCAMSWGLRVVNSNNVIIYGIGTYSFFQNYTQTCLTTYNCQKNIVSIESSTVAISGLSTVGTANMISLNGAQVLPSTPLLSTFASTLEFFSVSDFAGISTSKASTTTVTTTTTAAKTTTTTTTSTTTSAASGNTCNGATYNPAQYVCANNVLCPVSAPNSCNGACYSATSYCCQNNVLTQISQCSASSVAAQVTTTTTKSTTTTAKTTTTTTTTKVATTTASSSSFQLIDTYDYTNILSKVTFFTGGDPTHGEVTYVSESTAESSGLAYISNNVAYFGVDHTNVETSGRPSVRWTSNTAYQTGLFVFDIAHMPFGCGTWPALWLLGSGQTWPYAGEIDIIEGVNVNTANQQTLHTQPGCAYTASEMSQTGTLTFGDCNSANGANGNEGCGVANTQANSYGAGFNSNGGGVYATEWTNSAINIWFFPRNAIPSDITAGAPNPAGWGTPSANWPLGSLCSPTFFSNMQIVLDTTFCGDWAGAVYGTGCTGGSGLAACNTFVLNNPSAFTNAYWAINSLKVYSV
ncbi:hypothetical protein HK100_002560 [Physocladia obscura]|uniref:GH16 domain-containing protein n=1 Tax=Physocladia obscura TaxID=109957 RepID=A0AAD5XAZ8_9FUNG|nr:hypothetical protein HK100_002560 [Physocladia obscura]